MNEYSITYPDFLPTAKRPKAPLGDCSCAASRVVNCGFSTRMPGRRPPGGGRDVPAQ